MLEFDYCQRQKTVDDDNISTEKLLAAVFNIE